jgi:hypothetical protein
MESTYVIPPIKGIPVNIYRNAPSGDLNLLRHCTRAILVGHGMPELATSSKDCPIIYVTEHRTVKGYYYAAPNSGKWEMFGGCFVWSSDTRFRDIFEHPLPLHDRVEE